MTTPDGAEKNFSMRLIGEHNVINVVGAIALSHMLGISLEELVLPDDVEEDMTEMDEEESDTDLENKEE